jgi:hypothetical protein
VFYSSIIGTLSTNPATGTKAANVSGCKSQFQAPQAHTQPSQVNSITVYVIFFCILKSNGIKPASQYSLSDIGART